MAKSRFWTARSRLWNWLRGCTRTKREGRISRRPRRLDLELLESRLALATLTWTNSAGGNWGTASNWDLNRVPAVDDDVVIPDFAPDITVTYSTGTTAVNTLQSAEAFVLSGGSLALATDSAVSSTFTLSGGTLDGAGTLTVSGLFTWSSGTMRGSGKSVANGGMAISGSSVKDLFTRTVENAGTATWTGTGNIRTGSGGVFNNLTNAVFDIQNNQQFANDFGSGNLTFNNAGTLRKSAGTGTSTFGVVVNNTGTVDVQTGTLTLTGGGSASGTFTVAAGATMLFNTYSLNAGASGTGAGTFLHSSGTLTVAADVTVPNFALSGGTLTGGGTLTVSDLLSWTSGTMSGGGKTVIPNRMDVSGTSLKDLFTRTIENAGTVTWTGTGNIRTGSGGVFTNLANAVFDIQNNQSFANDFGSGNLTFHNTGTVRKSAGTGTTTFGMVFNNTGTVDVQTGTFTLTGGGAVSRT
jgi:hypothetical protein